MAGSHVKTGRLLLLVSVFAMLPTFAHASPVAVQFNFDLNYFNLRYGSSVDTVSIDQGFADPRDLSSWRMDTSELLGDFDIVGGSLNMITGPRLSITPYLTSEGTDAVYTYDGGGTFSLSFDLLLPNGDIQSGTFAAPLGPLTIDPGWSSVSGALGRGVFDAKTATLLGISRFTAGGDVPRYLDVYDQYPDPDRMEKWFGEVEITAEAPEPPVWGLLAVGAIGLAVVARRRQQLTVQ